MTLNLFNLLVFITIFQGLILVGIFYIRKKGNPLSNKLFASIILVYIVNLFDSFARSTLAYMYFMDYHKWIFISTHLAFLVGPLVYMYIKSLNNNSYTLSWKSLLHIVPFGIILLYAIHEVSAKKVFVIWESELYKFDMFAILIHMIIYILLSINVILNWENTCNQPKRLKDKNLDWIKYFVIGFIVVWITKLQSFAILMVAKKISWCAYTESVYYTSIFILINSIIVIGLINPDLIGFFQKKETNYLNIKDIESYKNKISHLLKNECIYRDPGLSIKDLGKILKLNTRYVSEVINREFEKSFFELINEYRIQESLLLLKINNGHRISIKEVCYNVGFNSRSAFNSSFKKYTGLTPSEFIKKVD